MDILQVFQLQGQLFLMILVGFALAKLKILDKQGRKYLTDVAINVIIPANIIKSFFIEFSMELLKLCASVLAAAIIIQVLFVIFNKFLYNGFSSTHKKIMQCATICSAGGFIGTPIAEGIFGEIGLIYSVFFLIPMRIMMWSTGVTYFVSEKNDPKKVFKTVVTHPCLVAIYIGLIIMVTQIPLPRVITSTISSLGGCNSAFTMIIIGTVAAEIDPNKIFDKGIVYFSVIRLGFLPFCAFLIAKLLQLDSIALGVCVIMTGMAAGSTVAIFAAKYDSNAIFATKTVVITTFLSLFTIPLWCMVI